MTKLFTLLALSLLFQTPAAKAAEDYNALVLSTIAQMPEGQGYSQTSAAAIALKKSVNIVNGRIVVDAKQASPVYCSGATYLVFLKVLAKLQEGGLRLKPEVMQKLLPRGQDDGTDVWGRWNSNGPGTARLFFELGAGTNFVQWEKAKPGDFMKIFWNEHIGKLERGHSVVYLGTEMKDGEEYVKFWSSNAPEGFSLRSIPKTRIIRALFSRFENPNSIVKSTQIPKSDDYLASLLTTPSSVEEMYEKTGVTAP